MRLINYKKGIFLLAASICSLIIPAREAAAQSFGPFQGGDIIARNLGDFILHRENIKDAFAKGKIEDFGILGGRDRYFSSQWVPGGATNVRDVVTENLKFNFDFVEHEVYAKFKDSAIVLNSMALKSFYLMENEVPHFFIKVPAIDVRYFFEVMGTLPPEKLTGKAQLLKLRTTTVKPVDERNLTAAFSGKPQTGMKNRTAYYVYYPDNTFREVSLNKKSFVASLNPQYQDKAAQFFASDKGSFNEEKALALMDHLNK